MRSEKEIKAMHVVSEPGDGTRYDYVFIRDHDDFHFMPMGSNFSYPQTISKWDIDPGLQASNMTVQEIARRFFCNPHTVVECMRSMKFILDSGGEDA